MVVDNDESVGALASEIRGLCIRVRWMLGTQDAVMEDVSVGHEVKYDLSTYGYSAFMGLTLAQLRQRYQSGSCIPEEISNIVEFSILPDFPEAFTSGDSPGMLLVRGDVIFVGEESIDNFILVQVLDKFVTFSPNEGGGYISNIPVRLYKGRDVFVREHLSSKNFKHTYARWEPVASNEYFFSNITFARQIQNDILNSVFIAHDRHSNTGNVAFNEPSVYGLRKISRYLSNIKTGIQTCTVSTASGGDEVEFAVSYLQVIMNCLIVIGHWIRYDLKYIYKGAEDPDFDKKCGIVAFSKIEGYVSMPSDPLSGEQQYGNMFSLENCINDWIYLWFQRIKVNPSKMIEFSDEIKNLIDFKTAIDSPDGATVLSDLLEYFIHGTEPPIHKNHAFQFLSRSLDMAINKTIGSVYGKHISYVTEDDISAERMDAHDSHFGILKGLVSSLDRVDPGTVRTIVRILSANSHEIKHMSCLKQGDIILVDDSLVASVRVLSFVDPFLSAYNELNSDNPWRRVVTDAREIEHQNDRSFRANIDYMINKMKAVLVLSPGDKTNIGFNVPVDIPNPTFDRDPRYFSVLSIQLTYTVHACFESDHTSRVQTTLDFTRIKLIGCTGREISHSFVDIFDESEAVRFRCGICHQKEFDSAWMYSGLCFHVYHERCVPDDYDRARCPICFRLTYAQRKGAAVPS